MCTVTLSAFTRGCNGVSGIEEIYMIDKKAREEAAVTVSVTNGAATIGGTGAPAFLWKPLQNGFSFTQPITQDNAAGTSSVLQTLEGTLHGYSASLVYLIDELRKGRFEAAIKMRNGIYIYAGLDQTGLQIAGGDSGATGQAINDPNGTTINMTCETPDSAPTFTFSEFETAFDITSAEKLKLEIMTDYRFGNYSTTIEKTVDGEEIKIKKRLIISDDTKAADVEAFLKICEEGTAKRIKEGNSEGSMLIKAKNKREAAVRAKQTKEAKEAPKEEAKEAKKNK